MLPRVSIAIVWCAAALSAATTPSAPAYTADSVVNAATQTVTALAPNTIATIYGTNLSFSTQSVTAADVRGGSLPNSLNGVTVYFGSFAVPLFYISPTQINFLVPYELIAGTYTLVVIRSNLAGPSVKIQLNATSPGMFQWNGNYAIAAHLNGVVVGPNAPAQGGEILVIYAVGLGRTSPDTTSGRVASSAAKIVALSQLQVLIGGVAIPASDILYAGLAPGFAGLYQINARLPARVAANPEIRIVVGPQTSPGGVQLAAEGSPAPGNAP